ncbi:MAG: hypothetical protein MJ185_11230 [Treponema sp.]|nr:hypothetical protein [Treponema sp.]
MQQTEITLAIIKLAAGGITAFLAIMLWSKTRDISWMSLVAGFITTYAGMVYDLMIDLHIITAAGPVVFGLPLSTLLFTIVPYVFFILAFILMLIRR